MQRKAATSFVILEGFDWSSVSGHFGPMINSVTGNGMYNVLYAYNSIIFQMS